MPIPTAGRVGWIAPVPAKLVVVRRLLLAATVHVPLGFVRPLNEPRFSRLYSALLSVVSSILSFTLFQFSENKAIWDVVHVGCFSRHRVFGAFAKAEVRSIRWEVSASHPSDPNCDRAALKHQAPKA